MFVDQIWPAPWRIEIVQAAASESAHRRAVAKRQDALLDAALEDSFPASDPISSGRIG